MVWWHWITLGVFLLIGEAVTPGGFYLLFLGAAALVVGFASPLIQTLWIEILLFAMLSGALIVVLRKPLVLRLKKDTPEAESPEFIGETGRAALAMAAGAEGSIELRGTTWKARNGGATDLAEKAACVVIQREGLLLIVKSCNQ